MPVNRFWIWVLCAVFPLILACPAALSANGGELAKLKTAQREAAEKTYQLVMALLSKSPDAVKLSELEVWSRHWLESELELSTTLRERIAAYESHLERIKSYENLARSWVKAGKGTAVETSAATYHRLEAEMWLLKEKAKTKN